MTSFTWANFTNRLNTGSINYGYTLYLTSVARAKFCNRPSHRIDKLWIHLPDIICAGKVHQQTFTQGRQKQQLWIHLEPDLICAGKLHQQTFTQGRQKQQVWIHLEPDLICEGSLQQHIFTQGRSSTGTLHIIYARMARPTHQASRTPDRIAT